MPRVAQAFRCVWFTGGVGSRHLTRAGVKEGLERVKRIPAAMGVDGTWMGFGLWDRAALKGEFLVLREWRDGRSVQVDRSAAR